MSLSCCNAACANFPYASFRCSVTASAVFAYLLASFFRNHFIGLEHHVLIAAVTVVCASVLLLVLWNGRKPGTSTSSNPSKLKDTLLSSSAEEPSSSGCCGGACSRAGAALDNVTCCQDTSDSLSIASSVGSHKGMSKESFHKWKRDNPEE